MKWHQPLTRSQLRRMEQVSATLRTIGLWGLGLGATMMLAAWAVFLIAHWRLTAMLLIVFAVLALAAETWRDDR